MPKCQKVRVITPRKDEIIRKCWEHNAYGHHAAKGAAQMTGLTPSVAHRRAMELGLVFTRERYRWTEPELTVVEANAHLSLETIQKKLRWVSPPGVKRTRAAIAGQIHNQRFRTNLDGLNHGSLADAVGISPDRLLRCREARRIKGERLESLRQACGYSDRIVDEHRHWFSRGTTSAPNRSVGASAKSRAANYGIQLLIYAIKHLVEAGVKLRFLK